MEHGHKTSRNVRQKIELDWISNLPSGVTQHILSCLPIRDAVRTSVLSKNWRYKWSMLPRLVFNESTIGPSTVSMQKIVDHVLLFHSGPIHKFSLLSRNCGSADINIWTPYLARNSIKEFILQKMGTSMPCNMFVCKDLTHLDLINCELLNPPSYFKGFNMLKTLYLRRVSVAENVLEFMILSSPRLQRVILCDLKGAGITNLNIDAPNLYFLKIEGGFRLKNSSNLVNVSIEGKQSAHSSTILIEFLLQLPRIQRLTLGRSFMEGAVDSLKEKLPERSLCLKYLSLSIALKNMDHILAAIFFLRSSPNLQELEISVCRENGETGEAISKNWLNVDQNCTLTKLRRLKLDGFSGSKAEADYTKFLFLNSPALRQLEFSFGTKPLEKLDVSWLSYGENSVFNQLRTVKSSGLWGVNAELDLIRFMYTSSPMLEKMTLQPANSSTKVAWEIAQFLVKIVKRDSVHADIELLSPPS